MAPTRILMVLTLVWSAQLALAQTAPTTDRAIQARAIVRDLAAGRFGRVETHYSDHGAYLLPPGRAQEMWQMLRGQFGPFRAIAGVHQDDSPGAHAQIVTCYFARGLIGLRIELDQSGKIADMTVTAPTVPSPPPARPVNKGAPRVVEGATQVCLNTENVPFVIENPGETPLLITLGVERWTSERGLRARWTGVQKNLAGAGPVRVEPQSKREVVWVANQPSRPPRLVAGRYRLVAEFSARGGHAGVRAVLHELDVTACITVLE